MCGQQVPLFSRLLLPQTPVPPLVPLRSHLHLHLPLKTSTGHTPFLTLVSGLGSSSALEQALPSAKSPLILSDAPQGPNSRLSAQLPPSLQLDSPEGPSTLNVFILVMFLANPTDPPPRQVGSSTLPPTFCPPTTSSARAATGTRQLATSSMRSISFDSFPSGGQAHECHRVSPSCQGPPSPTAQAET